MPSMRETPSVVAALAEAKARDLRDVAAIDRRYAKRLRELAPCADRIDDADAMFAGAGALEYRADVYERRARRAERRALDGRNEARHQPLDVREAIALGLDVSDLGPEEPSDEAREDVHDVVCCDCLDCENWRRAEASHVGVEDAHDVSDAIDDRQTEMF